MDYLSFLNNSDKNSIFNPGVPSGTSLRSATKLPSLRLFKIATDSRRLGGVAAEHSEVRA